MGWGKNVSCSFCIPHEFYLIRIESFNKIDLMNEQFDIENENTNTLEMKD